MGRDSDPTTMGLLESAEDVDTTVAGISALAEPIRRSLYRFVAASPEPVSRDQAADGVGVAPHVAKFHLDHLVDDGLLEFEYRRPPGRGGPGAGRPAKRYRRSAHQLSVSLPERRYEFAGQLLARAIADADQQGIPVREALRRVATAQGRLLGVTVLERVGDHSTRRDLEGSIRLVLAECGYEPRDHPDGMVLANCPFHSLAHEHTELVCSMNLDLLTGLTSALEAGRLDALLDPNPGRCCVRLRRTP
jgi:predicted ArsR family transcriptional regulator